MKTSMILACILLIVVPVRADDDNPASSLICGRFVISPGDRQSEVARKCGEPTDVETWEEERIKRDYYKNIPAETQEELSQEPLLLKEYIKVEEWTYNFGPTRFIYYLRFENGRLKRIASGDYGY
jgi:hypothetical protein